MDDMVTPLIGTSTLVDAFIVTLISMDVNIRGRRY